MFEKIKKFKNYYATHKVKGTIYVVIVAGLLYWSYGKITDTSDETKYTTATAQKGTIITSITGSGQVSAIDQVDIKPKVSGDVIYVGVQNGQYVTRGKLIAQLDTRDAEKAVRDAETNLETAKLSLEKVLEPADALSLIQSENSLTSATQAKTRADDDLAKAYDDSFTAISNAFIDLPPVMTGMQDVLYKNTNNASGQDNVSYYTDMVKNFDSTVSIYRDRAEADYKTARTAYDQTFLKYKSTSRYADKATIESLINDTAVMARAMTESAKSTSNFLNFVKDRLTERSMTVPSQLTTNITSINSYISSTNSSLSNLTNNINSIKDAKDSIINSEATIRERTESLAKLKAGSDELDIRSARIAVSQKENALQDAQDTLAKYYIYAPFNGIITQVAVKAGDSIGSGSSVATIVTNQKQAVISLNEVDVSKITLGMKATVKFDAIENLTVSGQVTEIDTIGTVSQGVVSYDVKIGFDTQDERVKTGMSVSAAIVTDTKIDVLTVPSGAVKTQSGAHYVELFDQAMEKGTDGLGTASKTAPTQQAVEIGASDDTLTEIISGLKEGDNVVTRTVTASSATKTTTSSLLSGNKGSPMGR